MIGGRDLAYAHIPAAAGAEHRRSPPVPMTTTRSPDG
jgi:hypothetical protein